MKNKALNRLIQRRYKGIYKGSFGTIIGYPTFNRPKPNVSFFVDGQKIGAPKNFMNELSRERPNYCDKNSLIEVLIGQIETSNTKPSKIITTCSTTTGRSKILSIYSN